MTQKMRIYIGGLGSSVQEDDLRKTFTSPQLGNVESVEIIRSKGRSFGYLEFAPASEKGLAKLFSTYNGCLWKGGRLKLEKAKEDYLARLQREWQEQELKTKLPSQDTEENESGNVIEKMEKHQDIEKMQLNIFFPKLRKIKAIPLKGTGRHKYSFRRVEIPPLPIHFCDCEEHSGPPLAKRTWEDQHEIKLTNEHEANDQETGIYEVNENELYMMKTILNKLLEKENSSVNVSDEPVFTEETNTDDIGANNWQVDNNEDEESDEGDLLINVTKQSSKRVADFEDWGQKTTAVKNQDSSLREVKSSREPIREMNKNGRERLFTDKKRKLSDQYHADDAVPSEMKAGKRARPGSGNDPVTSNIQPTDSKSGSVKLSHDVASSRKSAWRDLVREKESSAFYVSDILTVHNPKAETEVRSNVPADAPSNSGKNEPGDQLSEDNESEIVPNDQSTKPSTSEYKTARGAAWRQKLSWLQLLGDATTSAFNIGQILPGSTFEKQESQQNEKECLDSRSGEQHKVVNVDQKFPGGDIGELHGRVGKDVLGTQTNPNVDDLTKEPNHIIQDNEQSNYNSRETIEKKDGASAPLHGTSSAPNYRAVDDASISETCPFMRSAASMKEWTKAKAALSGAHKKKGKGKGPVEDY